MVLGVSRLTWQLWLALSHVAVGSWGLRGAPLSPSVSVPPLGLSQVAGLFMLWLKSRRPKRARQTLHGFGNLVSAVTYCPFCPLSFKGPGTAPFNGRNVKEFCTPLKTKVKAGRARGRMV